MKYIKWIVLLCSVALVACSTNNAEESERTYPQAFDFKTVTIQQLREEVTPPDSLNIEVFVFDIRDCPMCASVFPAGIIVSDSLNPQSAEEKLVLQLKKPEQFKKGPHYKYKISLQISGNSSINISNTKVLGYSQLPRYHPIPITAAY